MLSIYCWTLYVRIVEQQHIFEQQCRGHLRDYCRQMTRALTVKVVVL